MWFISVEWVERQNNREDSSWWWWTLLWYYPHAQLESVFFSISRRWSNIEWEKITNKKYQQYFLSQSCFFLWGRTQLSVFVGKEIDSWK